MLNQVLRHLNRKLNAKMNRKEFQALADDGYNRIPLVTEELADLDTPLSTFLKLANCEYSYLLESALNGGEKWSRFSIIGLQAHTILRVVGNTLTIERDGEVVARHETTDPLSFIEDYLGQFRVPDLPDLPPFTGGLVGYFGYDTVRFVRSKAAR